MLLRAERGRELPMSFLPSPRRNKYIERCYFLSKSDAESIFQCESEFRTEVSKRVFQPIAPKSERPFISIALGAVPAVTNPGLDFRKADSLPGGDACSCRALTVTPLKS